MTSQLRAARWARVSSAKQSGSEREGLPYQNDLQDEAMAHLHAHDTGLTWQIAHSGHSVHTTPAHAEMLDAAGKAFNVLLVAYQSRLGRNTEEVLRTVRLLHERGAFVYFAEEGRDTRDPSNMDDLRVQAAADENYRSKLSRTMQHTYESKFRRRKLPGGRPPFGYTPDWQIDPITGPTVRALYQRYASNTINQTALAARYDLEPELVKEVLRNRTYTGCAGRRGSEWLESDQIPAIVDPDLFEQVAQVREDRHRAGGPPVKAPSILQGRLWCVCGTPIRLDGRDGAGQPRVRHVSPCKAWGPQERRQARYFTEPLIAALSTMRYTDELIERKVAQRRTLNQTALPRPINWDRRRRALRDAYDAGRLTEAEYIAQGAALRAEEAKTAHITPVRTIDPESIRRSLCDLQGGIERMNNAPEPSRSNLLRWFVGRYFARIEYVSPDHLRPIPSDEGLQAMIAESFPRQVVLARPEGFEPPTC